MNNNNNILNVFEPVGQPIPDRQLMWAKWRDPFGQDMEEALWPGAIGDFKTDKALEKHKVQKGLVDTAESDPDFDEYDEDSWNEDEYDDENGVGPMAQYRNQKGIPFMVTPNGIIPITEHTRAGSMFDFWTAHCTFRLTKKDIQAIENTHGVETLDINTPYRWRVAVGKAFNSQEVKKWITINLNANPPK